LLWGLGLLAASLLILIVELFIPSAGILLATAAVVAVAGVICLWRHDAVWGVTGTALVVVGGPILLLFGLRIMPNTPIGRRLVLGDRQDDDDAVPPDLRPGGELSRLVGSEGVVLTDLRPIGTIKVEGERHSALSEMGMVRAGSRVRVVGVEGTELRVRSLS
jgi:membrane-bound ClpP family serine protease